jgi:hypothetical protein
MKKITLVIFAAFLAINCSNDDVIPPSNLNVSLNKTSLVEKQNEMNYDLWNEDFKIIGDLKVYDDNEYVYISCQTNSKFQITEIGLYLGLYENLPDFETNFNKASLTYHENVKQESTRVFHKIKKNQLKTDDNGCVFIATHFKIRNTETNQLESAYSVSNHFPRQTTWTHFLYCIR